jgi:hypothetical protein
VAKKECRCAFEIRPRLQDTSLLAAYQAFCNKTKDKIPRDEIWNEDGSGLLGRACHDSVTLSTTALSKATKLPQSAMQRGRFPLAIITNGPNASGSSTRPGASGTYKEHEESVAKAIAFIEERLPEVCKQAEEMAKALCQCAQIVRLQISAEARNATAHCTEIVDTYRKAWHGMVNNDPSSRLPRRRARPSR